MIPIAIVEYHLFWASTLRVAFFGYLLMWSTVLPIPLVRMCCYVFPSYSDLCDFLVISDHGRYFEEAKENPSITSHAQLLHLHLQLQEKSVLFTSNGRLACW